MQKANNDLRLACKGAGVPLYMVADALKISDQTLFRNWRKELSQNEKDQIYRIIEEIAKGGEVYAV